MASAHVYKSKEDYQRDKELEEARKAGTAAPEVDTETGQDINPHIPQYIAQAPWYLQSSGPTLKHQRAKSANEEEYNRWYTRGKTAGPAAKKYRKGACENCGAMTHKKRDCTERPRKKKAKFTNKDIRADEVVESMDFGFEGKRDRWAGYDPAEYKRVFERYEKLEKKRKKMKQTIDDDEEESDKQGTAKAKPVEEEDDEGVFSDSDDEESGKSDYEDTGMDAGEKVKEGTGYKMSVRNLRIREDTAKYLLNLHENSAYYDPKTRSMRQDPRAKDSLYKGDNFIRQHGDVSSFKDLQMYAWKAYEQGQQFANMTALPTQAEMAKTEHSTKKETLASEKQQAILDKYGGDEYSKPPVPKELLLAQSEAYVEYGPDGRVVKGQAPAAKTTKYEEDVHQFGHSSVWGSYFLEGEWGYKCCGQTHRQSYCTGKRMKDQGQVAVDLLEKAMLKQKEKQKVDEDAAYEKIMKKKAKENPEMFAKSTAGKQDVDEEEYEDYLRSKMHADDPMAKM